jgi:chloramphenicol-sensitive protein RarD
MGTSLFSVIPLRFFTLGARQINLSTVGRMQYLAPGGMFLLIVLACHEPFARDQAGTFLKIMIGFSKPGGCL